MGQLTSALQDSKLTNIKNSILLRLREYQKTQLQKNKHISNLEPLLKYITSKLVKQKYPVPDGLSVENFAQMLLLKTLCEEIREKDQLENGYRIEVADEEKTPSVIERGVLYISIAPPGGLKYTIRDAKNNTVKQDEISKDTLKSLGIVLSTTKPLNERAILRALYPHMTSLLHFLRKKHTLYYCPSYDAMLLKFITSYNHFFSSSRAPVFTEPSHFEAFVQSLLINPLNPLSEQKSKLMLAFAGHSITGGSDMVKYLDLSQPLLYQAEDSLPYWHNIFFAADIGSQTCCVDLYYYLQDTIGKAAVNALLAFSIEQIRGTLLYGEKEHQKLITEKKDTKETIEKLDYSKTQLVQLLFLSDGKPSNENDKKMAAQFAVEKIRECTTMEGLIETYQYYRNHPMIKPDFSILEAIATVTFFFKQPFYTDAEINVLIASQEKLYQFSQNTKYQSSNSSMVQKLYLDLFGEATIEKMRHREFSPRDYFFPPQAWVPRIQKKLGMD